MALKDEILKYVQQMRGGVSFAELSRFEGFGGKIRIEARENMVIWANMSQEAVDALNELRAEAKVHFYPTQILVYMADGAALDLPLAKSNRDYKKPHWLPCVVNLGPHPKANEKKAVPKKGPR